MPDIYWNEDLTRNQSTPIPGLHSFYDASNARWMPVNAMPEGFDISGYRTIEAPIAPPGPAVPEPPAFTPPRTGGVTPGATPGLPGQMPGPAPQMPGLPQGPPGVGNLSEMSLGAALAPLLGGGEAAQYPRPFIPPREATPGGGPFGGILGQIRAQVRGGVPTAPDVSPGAGPRPFQLTPANYAAAIPNLGALLGGGG